jgi:hypothetical protein
VRLLRRPSATEREPVGQDAGSRLAGIARDRVRLLEERLRVAEPVAPRRAPGELRQHRGAAVAGRLGGQRRLEALLAAVEVARVEQRREVLAARHG